MGTRGLWGFRLEGQEKLTYNHWDSYPTGLGDKLQKDLVHALGKIGLTQIKDTVKRIRLVSSKEEVTDLDVKKYSKWLSTNVGTSSDRDWYCLLRGLQGDLMETLEAEIMIDSHHLKEDVDCEWVYIIDLDDQHLEVYEHNGTRLMLRKAVPFDDLETFSMEPLEN